jgi:DNA-directed RNA polymerase specialized sigma24 family protein
MADESVTEWIAQLRHVESGDAQSKLWDRYFHRLVALARAKLGAAPRRAEDEEDVALSALNSFFEGAQNGEFPLLSDRTNLWPLLAKITTRKAINLRAKGLAKKRGSGAIRGDSVFAGKRDDGGDRGFAAVVSHEPTPQFAVEMADQCRRLLERLPQDLQTIARLKLYGYSNEEIAKEIGRVKRTVDRKLERIRAIWAMGSSETE